MASVEKIGIIGAGIMGSGIAQVTAQAGYQVVMKDVENKFLERGLSAIRKNLQLIFQPLSQAAAFLRAPYT